MLWQKADIWHFRLGEFRWPQVGEFGWPSGIERLRALALQGTALANAQVDTLRVKLLKLAAVVTRNTRRIRLYLASNWPSAGIFTHARAQLRSG